MSSSTVRLAAELERKGYLSLTKFVQYLKVHAPHAYISYPTGLKLVRDGRIEACKIGNSYRILRTEVARWVAHGNRENNEGD